ncbi:MAG: DNA repair protein RadC [Gammaproteobacteria bacterium]|nr:DNA repair protein RadC [Gammaproteobacteria bacterium]
MPITDWPLLERPREKLLRMGASTLSKAELIAIFLQTGAKGKTAIDLARELLREFHTLTNLLTASEHQFGAIRGLGKAKFSMLQAALELGRRYFEEEIQDNKPLTCAAEAKNYLIAKMSGYKQEVFACIFLTTKHAIIHYKELFYGTINCAPVFPRIIAQKALEYNAGAIILAHNHPSGNTEPSQNDISATQDLIPVLRCLDIRVLDHIIVANKECRSLAEEGHL